MSSKWPAYHGWSGWNRSVSGTSRPPSEAARRAEEKLAAEFDEFARTYCPPDERAQLGKPEIVDPAKLKPWQRRRSRLARAAAKDAKDK